MIKKIKSFAIIIASSLMLAMPAVLPTAISYADACQGVPQTVTTGATAASGSAGIGCDASGNLATNAPNQLGVIAHDVVNIFSVIVGAAAIIMIIYSGFRYITSGGSSERIGSAKTTLIYAIIGLIVVALAQILVHFVLSASVSTGTSLTS